MCKVYNIYTYNWLLYISIAHLGNNVYTVTIFTMTLKSVITTQSLLELIGIKNT